MKYVWVVALTAMVISILLYLRLQLQRKKYEKNMAEISEMLERMLLGNRAPVINDREDILVSKIQHQILRIAETVTATKEEIRRDRDEIRILIAEIAHQLRTPLMNIETYMDLLKSEENTQVEQREYLNSVEEAEQKLRFLIEAFIKMSRLEQKVIQIIKEDNDLRETVLNAMLQIEGRAKRKGISFVFTETEKIPVKHDKNWLGEAVFNLLDNAVKYAEEFSTVSVEIQKNEMFAAISVRDTGKSIQPGEESEIFKRFYRGKNITNEDGFGIGLYIAREIVKRHNGILKAVRQADGMEFKIYLPFYAPDDL